MWLHNSKWDVLEWRWLSRANLPKYPDNIIEVQIYGKKYYLDLEAAADFIINKLEWRH